MTAFPPSLRSWLSMSACSYLGEALRALLVLEMRGLTVHNQQATERVPAHLPQGCTAVRCNVRSASGGHATVVLGGPPDGESTALEAEFGMHDPGHPCRGEFLAGASSLHCGHRPAIVAHREPPDMGDFWRGRPGAAPAHPCCTLNRSCLRPLPVSTHEPWVHHQAPLVCAPSLHPGQQRLVTHFKVHYDSVPCSVSSTYTTAVPLQCWLHARNCCALQCQQASRWWSTPCGRPWWQTR